MADAFQNVNNLFLPDRLAALPTFPEWSSEQIETSRRGVEELLEKRRAVLEEKLSEIQTQYHWVSYVLRCLGYCATASEAPPLGTDSEEYRPDFTLFASASDFRRAVPHRGHRDFFTGALAIVRSLDWDASLDDYESEEGNYNPAYDVDRHLRNTGLTWGILTNGRIWRLFHRDTSGLMSTYFEIDLLKVLEDKDPDAFKFFWAIFSPDGLGGSTTGQPIAHRLLN
ncbi:MAG: hypothetical protein H0U74_17385 [Bradymonadaceae bacterium]|nr:hypothetical protein [Lujinxingiaceae bacterium]